MRTAAAVLLVYLAALAATLALQFQGGAYAAEFTQTSDESAHYVTGLLVHDFVAAGAPRPVSPFYRQFHEHYPNVGIGHWPPGFYLLQAAWSLLFGISRSSMLLLMAMCNAGLVTGTYYLIKSALSLRYALCGSLLLLTIPAAQVSARSLMGEVPMALLELAAVAAFRLYLKQERPVGSALFGLFAAAALLTKGTAVMLAIVPPVGVLLQRRPGLLFRWHSWLPAGIVAMLCVPWYLEAPGALHDQVAFLGGLTFLPGSFPETFLYLQDNLGNAVLAAALVGMAATLRAIWNKEQRDPIWPLALVVVTSSILFRAFVAVWEPRHLLTAVPWILLFAADAIRRMIAHRGLVSGIVAGASVMTVAIYCVWNVWSTPMKVHLGLDEAALSILATPELEKVNLLVISDLRGEGVFTAEIAAHERRPGHRVLRGSQILAHTSFLGDESEPRFHETAPLMRYLAGIRPLVVILDDPALPFSHAKLVRDTIAENPAAWQKVGSSDGLRGPIETWRLQ
ncbi:MAG: glycosyltransferase family 39 protein [Acidobacteriota bacterium]